MSMIDKRFDHPFEVYLTPAGAYLDNSDTECILLITVDDRTGGYLSYHVLHVLHVLYTISCKLNLL